MKCFYSLWTSPPSIHQGSPLDTAEFPSDPEDLLAAVSKLNLERVVDDDQTRPFLTPVTQKTLDQSCGS